MSDIQKWTKDGWKYQKFELEGNEVVWRRELNPDHKFAHHGLSVLEMWVNGEYVGHKETFESQTRVLYEMYKSHK